MRSRNELWFKDVFGFEETTASVKKYLSVEMGNDSVIMKSSANNSSFNAGIFRLATISSFQNLSPRGNGKLHLIHGHGRQSTRTYLTDILESQAYPDNDGATFQAASNFNCLEFTSSYQTASNGITNYVFDPTQGPFCAIAAGPAIAYRNYFVEVEPGVYGQLNKEINLLCRTPIKVRHGYPSISSAEVQQIEALAFNWSDPENYQVGVHSNCEVTSTRQSGGSITRFKGNQIVHHVYCAAFNLMSDVVSCDFTMEMSKHLLSAEYRATILAAWDNSIKYPGKKGSNKLYLTLLGGGVFGNPIPLICSAIKANMDVIKASGLDVTLVCFNDMTFEAVKPELMDSVQESGGSVINA